MSCGEFSSFDSFFMEPMPELEPRDSSLFATISNVEQRYVFKDIDDFRLNKSKATVDQELFVAGKVQAQNRHPRTAFSSLQKRVLEEEFQRCSYPSSRERAILAYVLELRPEVVQNWFKRKRYRRRRESPSVEHHAQSSNSVTPEQSVPTTENIICRKTVIHYTTGGAVIQIN
ncbi:unnamed protein product [Porites evermanni]|uniref:Homeobox domain-containing protein n=1 Tax=Porites evermanni TaxID=104178 RepID=A0ABN8SA90_9CNID|nr:unnamed protein product [Porites evermanni]